MKTSIYVLLLCLLTSCAIPQSSKKPVSEPISIDYEQLIEKINSNEDFLLYIGRSDCQDCIEFEEWLIPFLTEHPNIELFSLDIKAFRDAARSENASEDEKVFFQNIIETLEFDWTPTLQHRQGDVILSSITFPDITDESAFDKEVREASLVHISTWLINEKTAR